MASIEGSIRERTYPLAVFNPRHLVNCWAGRYKCYSWDVVFPAGLLRVVAVATWPSS